MFRIMSDHLSEPHWSGKSHIKLTLMSLKCPSHQPNDQGAQDMGFIKVHKVSLCLELVRMKEMVPTQGSFILNKMVLIAWMSAFTN